MQVFLKKHIKRKKTKLSNYKLIEFSNDAQQNITTRIVIGQPNGR